MLQLLPSMGRIKTQLVKRIGTKIFKEHKESFKTDFNDNKPIIPQYAEIRSKKLRNIIAGYLTRLKKQEE